METQCCNNHKTKQRTQQERKALINRLSRIEGQVRGVKSMLENDAYCTDVMIQVAAINAALNSFNKELLSEHINSCVVNGIRNGDDETVSELVNLIGKLMK